MTKPKLPSQHVSADEAVQSLNVTGLVLVVVGLALLMVGAGHIWLKVLGIAIEIVGVLLLGIAIGMQRK